MQTASSKFETKDNRNVLSIIRNYYEIMTKYDLLSWGANSHSQLGQEVESEQCLSPMAVNLNSFDFKLNEIKKITGGAGHSLLLTKKGEVYSCGLNTKGQAGRSIWLKKLSKFEKIDELKDETIVEVACGWDSSMAINKNGHLFAWGSNAFGQLGFDHNPPIDKLNKPTKIQSYNGIENNEGLFDHVAMGLRHTVIVTKNGKVLVTGYGNKCQLGLTDSANKHLQKITTFTRVPGLTGAKRASCGQHHTVILNKNGDLWVWGDNKYGQLGIDAKKYATIDIPKKLTNLNVGLYGEIFTGWTHTIAFHDGKVLAWGRNTYGQIGGEEGSELMNESSWKAKLIKNFAKFTQIATGSEHNVALADDGSIKCWGWNEHGNCGTGNDKDVRVPTSVKIPDNCKGILVGSGYGHSFAVVKYNQEK